MDYSRSNTYINMYIYIYITYIYMRVDRREKIREENMHEKVGKSRNTVFYQ